MAVEPVPIVSSIDQIYQPPDLLPQSARFNAIRKLFVEKYGHEADFFARSPGRVNLIGEHIDYCGFSVFPMAVDKDIVIAVGIDGNSRRVRVANVDEKYPPVEFELSSAEEGYCTINAAVHEWSNYFKCGVRGILEHVRPDAPKGMECIVSGTVPSGAGLSSSSAFVCCSALATLTANGTTLTKTEVAEIAIRAERYVGVNSGGMDQTVSICSIPNHALHVEFQPALHPTPIPFPVTEPPLVFVIANTLIVSNKLMSAPMCYNLRVVETRAAALALARALDLSVEHHGELSTLREVCVAYFSTRASQNELAAETVGLWKRMLEEMIELVELHIRKREGYTKEEMIEATGVSDFESRYMTQFPVRADVFHLYSRAKHVYSESLRVYEFRDTCEKCSARVEQGTPSGTEVLQKLGSLMNMSQDSCRDDFDCSCPEIDELVGHCRLAGALGSRLTGAGWGGCTVSLVPQTIVENFIDNVKDAYYRPRGLSEEVINGAIFATRPGNGAAVMKF